MAWSTSMRTPPAATAAVSVHDPVSTATAAQAAAVVARWPPGLMPSLPRSPCRFPVRPRVLYSRLGSISRRWTLVSEYVPVAIFAALIVAFGVVSLAVARLLRPSRPDIVKLMNYECGAEPIGPAWIRFPVRFYLVALVFIVFDAHAVCLVPV